MAFGAILKWPFEEMAAEFFCPGGRRWLKIIQISLEGLLIRLCFQHQNFNKTTKGVVSVSLQSLEFSVWCVWAHTCRGDLICEQSSVFFLGREGEAEGGIYNTGSYKHVGPTQLWTTTTEYMWLLYQQTSCSLYFPRMCEWIALCCACTVAHYSRHQYASTEVLFRWLNSMWKPTYSPVSALRGLHPAFSLLS